jgi:hypothetical protein
MIDAAARFESWFLWVAAAGFAVVYAVPLLVAPLAWAKVFSWKVPEERGLAVYLGRCLGGVAVAIIWLAVRAAPHPRAHKELFELMFLVGVMMTGVHVWGALRREQPWIETVEIGLYAGLAVVSGWIARGL